MEKRSSSFISNKKALASLAAILSLCLVFFFAYAGGQKAQAVNVSAGCSITANVDTARYPNPPDNLQIALYKVADAVPEDGYDAFTFASTQNFTSMRSDIDALNGQTTASTSALEAMAQTAAGIVASAQTPLAPVAGTPASAGSAISGLDAGIYLLVASGADISDDAEIHGSLTNLGGKWVSEAYSADNKFTFEPQLVSVPTKDAAAGSIPTTATPGEWIYNVNVTLKCDYAPRTGSLRITKNLLEMAQIQGVANEATFVFDIKGYRGDELVYTNVASIKFTAAGSDSVVIDNIPAGLTVVVSEVYSGTSYTTVTDTPQSTTIVATDHPTITVDPATVNFENTYDGNSNRGGSVTNSFEFGDEEWTWSNDGQVA